MQALYQASDALQATLLRDHLAAHHIESIVLGDYLSGAAGELSAVNFPVVWLLEDRDLPRGRELLAIFLTDQPAGEPWTCPACDAEVEGEFLICWQCGKQKPDDEQH